MSNNYNPYHNPAGTLPPLPIAADRVMGELMFSEKQMLGFARHTLEWFGVESAVRTLEKLGYTYHGGKYWKPPIGPRPDFDADGNIVIPQPSSDKRGGL